MLKERIKLSNRGFSVFRVQESEMENRNSERKLFYGLYSLKDESDVIPELREAAYWKPMNTDSENIIDVPDSYVYLVERDGENTIEEYRFFWSATGRKPTLDISESPAGKLYGPQSYMITIRWLNGPGEQINNEYIYLKSNEGDRYHFLRKYVGDRNRSEESYVYVVPEGDSPQRYTIEVLPQLREKYSVSIH